MNPEKEIELNSKILSIVQEIMNLPNMADDKELQDELEFFSRGLRLVLLNRICKYEYYEYYLKAKNRKKLEKKLKLNVNPVVSITQGSTDLLVIPTECISR